MPKKPLSATLPDSRSNVIHFPGLNAYRFLAATLVAFVHVEDIRRGLRLTSFSLPLTDEMGGLAVTFFFVLSGFLITYLLLKEKQELGTIAIRKFYWRRALRIWPLYYLIILLAFGFLCNPNIFPAIATVATYQGAPTNLVLHLALLPNIALVLDLQITYANQLWSIGAEEQFYLLWPFVIKYLTRRGQLVIMIGLVVFFIAVQSSMPLLLSYFPAYKAAILYLRPLLIATRISCMAVGGIGAYMLFFHPSLLHTWLSSALVDVLIIVLIIFLVITDDAGTAVPYAKHEIFSLLFCYVILSSSIKTNSVFRLKSPKWERLGQLSYGIYMWHLVVIGLLECLIKANIISGVENSDLLLYIGTLPLTIIVAWLSYLFVEKPFLTLKNKFVRVGSRSNLV